MQNVYAILCCHCTFKDNTISLLQINQGQAVILVFLLHPPPDLCSLSGQAKTFCILLNTKSSCLPPLYSSIHHFIIIISSSSSSSVACPRMKHSCLHKFIPVSAILHSMPHCVKANSGLLDPISIGFRLYMSKPSQSAFLNHHADWF